MFKSIIKTGKSLFSLKVPTEVYDFTDILMKGIKFYKKSTFVNVRSFTSLIITNLIKRSFSSDVKYQVVYVSLSPNSYTRKEMKKYSLDTAQKTIELLKSKNIISVNYGSYRKGMTELRLLPITAWNIDISIYERLRLFYMKWNHKIEKTSNYAIHYHKEYDASGKTIRNCTISSEMENQIVEKINKYNEDLGIRLPYQRIYGETTKEYGRLYNPFNFLKKSVRRNLEKSENLIEIDFPSFNLNTLYIKKTGDIFNNDPYEKIVKNLFDYYFKKQFFTDFNRLEESDIYDFNLKVYRSLLKPLCNIILSSKNKASAQKSIRAIMAMQYHWFVELNKKEIKNECNNDLYKLKKYEWCKKAFFMYIENKTRKEYSNFYGLGSEIQDKLLFIPFKVDDFINIFEEVHSKVCEYFYSSITAWAQKIESNIMIKIADRMMECNLPVLLSHDCCYVKNDKRLGEFFNVERDWKEYAKKLWLEEIKVYEVSNV